MVVVMRGGKKKTKNEFNKVQPCGRGGEKYTCEKHRQGDIRKTRDQTGPRRSRPCLVEWEWVSCVYDEGIRLNRADALEMCQ